MMSSEKLGNISEIAKDDIPDCVRVIRESFMTVAREFGITEENAPRFTAFAVSEERLIWQLEQEKRLMFKYCEDNAVIGYYSLCAKNSEECELNNLCVVPEFRHHGIGEGLLKHSFEAAGSLNCKKMFIGIVEENVVLKSWYEGFGFVHIGAEKPDFFPFTCGYMEKKL